MAIDLKVPEVGESITEVEISDWLVKEGQAVEKDQDLVVIETDKVTVEVPAPEAGVLTEIKVEAGSPANVGDVIAVIDPDAEPSADDEQDEDTSESEEPEESEEKAEDTEEDQADDQDTEPEKSDDVKVESAEGTGTPWEGEDEASKQDEPETDEDEKEDQPRIMPAAKRLMAEHDLAPHDVEGTGKGGRILKEDVQRRIDEGEKKQKKEKAEQPEKSEKKKQAPAEESETDQTEPRQDEDLVRMTPMRRKIAERLVSIQQNAALLTTFNEIDMQAVMDLRGEFKQTFADVHGIKLGFMSFFVKAAAQALSEVPEVNAEIRGENILYKHHYDIGVAVSTEKGLLVPVLRNADRMSFAEIENKIGDLATRARDGKIELKELEGGTFTITNGGVFGSLLSTPILNPPQSGILGMHAIQDRPVAVDGEIVIRPMMYIALTYDHRIVDGKGAVTFLRRIKELVENPSRLMLEV